MILGVVYAFATPPCYVPDEIGHFWRAVSVAHGTVFPAHPPAGLARAPLPEGYQVFVFCVYRDLSRDGRVTPDQFQLAWTIDERPHKPVMLPVVTAYSPVSYVPQISAAAIGRAFGIRPMIVFYLGRLFALFAFVALVRWAIVVTPFLKTGFMAVALLPMTLYMAASWSADSLTIALAFLATALALRATGGVALPLVSLLLGLCKPPYLLIPAVALAKRRWVPIAIALAVFVITLLAGPEVPARSGQMDCLKADPLLIARDYAERASLYAEQAVGRLGLLDVFLPRWLVVSEWLVLIAIAVTAGEAVGRAQRLLGIAVCLAMLAGISAALYLTWTPSCAALVEGIQGRYLLPIVPLVMVTLSNPRWSWWRPGAAFAGFVALIANTVALQALVARYYGA